MKRSEKTSRSAYRKGKSAEMKKAQRRAERAEARRLLQQRKYEALDGRVKRRYFGWND